MPNRQHAYRHHDRQVRGQKMPCRAIARPRSGPLNGPPRSAGAVPVEQEVAVLTAELEDTDLSRDMWVARFGQWRNALDRL